MSEQKSRAIVEKFGRSKANPLIYRRFVGPENFASDLASRDQVSDREGRRPVRNVGRRRLALDLFCERCCEAERRVFGVASRRVLAGDCCGAFDSGFLTAES